MQVNFNTQNTVRPQFGMAIKATPEAMDNLVKKFKIGRASCRERV